jgi:hypothetical protein
MRAGHACRCFAERKYMNRSISLALKSLSAFAIASTLSLGFTEITHAASGAAQLDENGKPLEMTVFKTPWCGCCAAWVDAMREVGFEVAFNDLEDLSSIKKQASITSNLEGCHTAVLDGYVLEGHVPLQAVEKLLAERPSIRGLAVPGMPAGSLGMGYDPKAEYEVFAYQADTAIQPEVFYRTGQSQ